MQINLTQVQASDIGVDMKVLVPFVHTPANS